ncbi:MAG: 3-oxoacyl-[acyl-carrier-protein] reductase [Calditrichia bacterium]
MNIKDKVAVVTGSTRGIGRAVAVKLGSAGATVVVSGRNEQLINEVVSEINNNGGNALGVAADISQFDDAKKLIDTTIKEFGRIDILVNNAGVTRDNLLALMKEEDWDTVMNINLKGAFNCVKNVIRPMMKQRWGRIINITSVVGITGNAGQANYASSKAGLIGFTKSVAKELAGRNITCNAIAPGFIDTDMTRELPEKVKENLLQSIPLGRFGSGDDIANAVLFLSSDLADYITGQVLNVDGGMVM